MIAKIFNTKNFFYLVWAAFFLFLLRDLAHARTPFTDDMKSVKSPSEMMMDHAMRMMHTEEGTSIVDTASTLAYKKANETMHHGMAITFSGDADVDFIKGMIPHHQGAIDMAKVVLNYGKDPFVRTLANNIMAAQEKEIAEMKEWLHKHGK